MAMTQLDDGTYVTDLDNDVANSRLSGLGYSIRHIETWERLGCEESFVVWDAPALTEADLPY